MNNNSRWRNYGLWVSIAAVIPLLLSAFGIKVVPSEYQEIVNAVLAILVTAGIISNPTTTSRWFTDDPNQTSDKTTDKTDEK
ncbi:holin [Niameybacter massiliensis]|uniref:Holin n=1 Tax=Holtiella tumoricola TaxID=3018743 RepID=A0AA42DQL9_9FIRM|nr:holin [Holtiella tumoricola]MDA3733410.1 holin [Holtiella tumoricola]